MKKQCCVSFLLFYAFFLFSQETVFIESNEIGNGIICMRAGECVVITPNHVVFDSGGDEILISDKNKVNTTAHLIQAFSSDLAILKISKEKDFVCKDWEISSQFKNALDDVSTGFVEYLDESGISNLVHVNITSKDETSFIIMPQNANIGLQKGMSGSSFYINYKGEKILAGMLMSMEEDSVQAFVLQIDDIMRLSSPFFDVKRQGSTTYNGPKRIGIMLFKDRDRFVEINNQLAANINKGTAYRAYSKFLENDYIENKFDNIVLGQSDLIVPEKLQKELDELLLGDITFEREKNRKNMFIVRARLNASMYLTSNLSLIDSFVFMGKGLGFDEKSAEKQALKSLLTNIENQFK